MPFHDDVAEREGAEAQSASSSLAPIVLTDAHRLAVLAELWAETEAGSRWVPLAIAAQRYEQRVRGNLSQSLSEKAAE